MPFTPKFVDMVRNLTTSTGTGAINLGSTPSGYTGLSAALTAGDQFYYCIQGVDKPSEREVGRGTMLGNGTIAREAISGGLTNFTPGTKTIALVTAAEWFAKIEQGGGGGGGGGGATSLTVAGPTQLAALPIVNGAAALMLAPGREGLFVFSGANLSALVTADTRQGIYIAPAAAATGASGAWVRKFDGPVQLKWFGPAGDFVTDDLPAFEGAHDVIKARQIFPGAAGAGELDLGPGRFYLSAMWNIHTALQIKGAGSAQPYGAATLLRFAKNSNGIILNHGNTDGDTVGTQGSAEGSTLEGVQLWGGNVNVNGAGVITSYTAGDSLTGHGVRIRGAFIQCRDVASYFFGGDGFNIIASAGSGGASEGNANSFMLDRCQAQFNRGNGYLVAGTDANAGRIDTCSSISNGGAGFLDFSFLGNTYIQCHVRDCGVDDSTTAGIGSGGPTGTCVYAGVYYYVVAGQEVAASTIVPGTNPAVWRTFAGHPYCKTWVSGLTWVNPSPFGTNPANINGRNVFVGCYAESAQPPCQATYPTLFIGGLLDEVTVVGSASWVRGTAEGGLTAGNFVSINPADITNITQFGNPDGKTIFDHQRGGATSAKMLGRDDFFGKKALELRLDNAFTAFNVGLEATHPYGYGSMAIGKLFIGRGDVNEAIRLGTLNGVADINGQTVTVGATFLDTNPVLGTPAGWVCTVPGTVGSGAVFADLAPLGLATANTAELHTGAAANRFVSPFNLFAAAAPVVLVDGAVVTIDGASGFNFNLTLGGNRTLANPTNMKPGQSGRIRVRQDATGSRTLAFGANWLFAGGDPTLSTAATAIDVIAYFVNSATEIEATIVKALS